MGPTLNLSHHTITGQELSDLLAPITPEVFIAEYWGRKPLFIKGNPTKLEKLFPDGFDRAAFFQATQKAASAGTPGFYLGATNSPLLPTDEQPTEPFFSISSDQMEAQFDAGASMLSAHLSDTRLAQLAAALKTQLHHVGDVDARAVLSPEGTGTGAHLDKTSGILIHCEGRKRFLISDGPVMAWPRDDATFSADGTGQYNNDPNEGWEPICGVDLSHLTELVMEPGDVLCLPTGTVHATQAIDGYSLGVNLQLTHTGFLELINHVLESLLMHNPNWRHLPLATALNMTPGQLPTEMVDFFAARLDELRATLGILTADAFVLNREWYKRIGDPGNATRANLSLTPTQDADRPVRRKDVLQLSRRAPMTYAVGTEGDEPHCYLYYADLELSMAGEWFPFLQSLVQQDRFVAAEATRWAGNGKRYPWKMVQEYLQVLLVQGIIEHAA